MHKLGSFRKHLKQSLAVSYKKETNSRGKKTRAERVQVISETGETAALAYK